MGNEAGLSSEDRVPSRGTPLSFLQLRSIRRKKKAIIVLSIVAAVGIVLLANVLYYRSVPDMPAYDPTTPEDYTMMTPTQIRGKLYHDTKLDTEILVKRPITDKTFKNHAQAYEAGRALAALGKPKYAGRAYAVALKRTNSSTPYKFYMDYNAVADANRDTKLSKELFDKTLTAIKADKKLSEAAKNDLIATITMKKKLKELEQ